MVAHPVYIPSKGRADQTLAAELLDEAGLDFHLVVEPQEEAAYREWWGDRVLVLDEDDRGIAYTRNACKQHAVEWGMEYHWQIDDNVKRFMRFVGGSTRVEVPPSEALDAVERLVSQYTNVGISGIMHAAFGFEISEPFSVNQQVYSAVLVRSDEHRWREGLVEDTDYSLQVLAGGDCTILVRVYQFEKPTSGVMSGGNTDTEYAEHGRLERSQKLQQTWPGLGIEVVRTARGRPGVKTSHLWRRFDQQLVRADEI